MSPDAGTSASLPPLVVVWRVLTGCNQGCGFCAYDRALPGARVAVAADTVLRVGRLLAAWSRQRGRPVLLSLLGGEPLLWPPLAEVLTALAAEGLRLSLTSNGSRLERPALRALLADTLTELTLSLDGPAEVHDALRGAPGAHARLLAAIDAFVAMPKRPLLRVNTVLMRSTAPHYPRLVATLAARGVDALTWNLLGGRDRPDFEPAERLSPAALARTLRALDRVRARLPATVRVQDSAGYRARQLDRLLGRPRPVADCAPGRDFAFIDEHGRIGPCSFTLDRHGLDLAEFSDLAALDALAARLRARRAAAPDPACADCPSTQVFGKYAEPLAETRP